MKMRGKRKSNNKFRINGGSRTISCSCPDCIDVSLTLRADEKRETEREIADQISAALPSDGDDRCASCYFPEYYCECSPVYSRFYSYRGREADPVFEQWRWWIFQPGSDPEIVAAITAHLNAHPECKCDFWTPEVGGGNFGKATCQLCGVSTFRIEGMFFEENPENPVEMMVLMFIKAQHLTLPMAHEGNEPFSICGCCWKRETQAISGDYAS